MTLYDTIEQTLEQFKDDYRDIKASNRKQILASRLEAAVRDFVNRTTSELAETEVEPFMWTVLKGLVAREGLSVVLKKPDLYAADLYGMRMEDQDEVIVLTLVE